MIISFQYTQRHLDYFLKLQVRTSKTSGLPAYSKVESHYMGKSIGITYLHVREKMEFYMNEVIPEVDGGNNESNDTKTEQVIEQLNSEIENTFSKMESGWSNMWNSASKNANELQRQYHLEEYKKGLFDQLQNVKNNMDNTKTVQNGLGAVEEQLKNLGKQLHVEDVQNATSNVLENLDGKIEQVEQLTGKYVSQFASLFSGMFAINPAESEKEELFSRPSLNPREEYGTSRYENELYTLHTDPSYYLDSEKDNKEELDLFKEEEKTEEIAALLKKYPKSLEKLMNELVPLKVSYKLFWYRYFKAREQLTTAEQKRKQLMASKSSSSSNPGRGEVDEEEENFAWDDEDDADVVDLGKEVGKTSNSGKKTVPNEKVKHSEYSKAKPQEAANVENENENANDDDDDDWE